MLYKPIGGVLSSSSAANRIKLLNRFKIFRSVIENFNLKLDFGKVSLVIIILTTNQSRKTLSFAIRKFSNISCMCLSKD